MFFPCSKLIQRRQKLLSEGVKWAQKGVCAKPPPHMHTAAPLINYHHDSRGGTQYNAVSDCHSHVLPHMSTLTPSIWSSSLQLPAMRGGRSPAFSRASSGQWLPHGLAEGVRPPPQTFGLRSARRGKAASAVRRGSLQEGRGCAGYGCWHVGWWLRRQRACSRRSDIRTVTGPGLTNPHRATCNKHGTLTADPAAQPPLLLGNTLNPNTRSPQFVTEIVCLQILFHRLWQLL